MAETTEAPEAKIVYHPTLRGIVTTIEPTDPAEKHEQLLAAGWKDEDPFAEPETPTEPEPVQPAAAAPAAETPATPEAPGAVPVAVEKQDQPTDPTRKTTK